MTLNYSICYIKPVLAFGTEQDIIVNSHRPSQTFPKIKLFNELSKECHLQVVLS
jgi:hypothetical protein